MRILFSDGKPFFVHPPPRTQNKAQASPPPPRAGPSAVVPPDVFPPKSGFNAHTSVLTAAPPSPTTESKLGRVQYHFRSLTPQIPPIRSDRVFMTISGRGFKVDTEPFSATCMKFIHTKPNHANRSYHSNIKLSVITSKSVPRCK
jgi:hypothetical protein